MIVLTAITITMTPPIDGVSTMPSAEIMLIASLIIVAGIFVAFLIALPVANNHRKTHHPNAKVNAMSWLKTCTLAASMFAIVWLLSR